jgi:hypothetical protein
MYLILSLSIFGISYLSSAFIWFADGPVDSLYYYYPLSFPLEVTAYTPPILVYPSYVEFRLNIFLIPIIEISGSFGIERLSETVVFPRIPFELTLNFTLILFLINMIYVVVSLLILSIILKKVSEVRKGLPHEQEG